MNDQKTASSTSKGHTSKQTELQQPVMKQSVNNMSGIFTRLKDRFVCNNNNNRNNFSNRPPDNPHLSITRQSTRSNTTFRNAPTESATFNSIVQDATHTRAVSLAAIPISTDTGDPDDTIPVRGVYQLQTHTISDRRA